MSEARMAPERKIEANRQNAKRSTGPKTERGKAKSSRNARQHGLSSPGMEEVSVSSSHGDSATARRSKQQQNWLEVDDLVQANRRLGRIRQARYELLVALLECPTPKLAKRLAGLERYERPARAAQRRFLKRWLKQG
ncbi:MULTISPECIES: hypothetical protein [Bradyrhizobium]|nr:MULTISPECIES: hypothetical protein [Bradyrhizobium]